MTRTGLTAIGSPLKPRAAGVATITGGTSTIGLTVTFTISATSSGSARPMARAREWNTPCTSPTKPLRCSPESLMTTLKLSVRGSPVTTVVGV